MTTIRATNIENGKTFTFNANEEFLKIKPASCRDIGCENCLADNDTKCGDILDDGAAESIRFEILDF
jgi:hypothetical protein